MRLKYFLWVVLGWVNCATSCVSDKPDVEPDIPLSASSGSGLFIINEGNYQWGNSSISYYKFSDGSVIEDVFKTANARPLGDVGQSMEVVNQKAYVVVNNSNKIEIVDPKDFKSLGSISGLRSPRYFLPVTNSKAYVTDFLSNAVAVIDLNTNAKIKDIACKGWTEELCLSNGKAFVTNLEREYVYVIDTQTDVMKDSIHVGYGSNSIKTDKNGKLWVLCSGNGSSIPGSFHRIDPLNEQLEWSVTFTNASQTPWKLDINGTKDTLYYLNNGVYKFPITHTSLPTQAFIPQNSFLFYGLAVDPNSGTLYVSDAIDYVQNGKVYKYRTDGTLITTFNVGISPGEFYFY